MHQSFTIARVDYCIAIYNNSFIINSLFSRSFGESLGNCISDKDYLKFITKQPKSVRATEQFLDSACSELLLVTVFCYMIWFQFEYCYNTIVCKLACAADWHKTMSLARLKPTSFNHAGYNPYTNVPHLAVKVGLKPGSVNPESGFNTPLYLPLKEVI